MQETEKVKSLTIRKPIECDRRTGEMHSSLLGIYSDRMTATAPMKI